MDFTRKLLGVRHATTVRFRPKTLVFHLSSRVLYDAARCEDRKRTRRPRPTASIRLRVVGLDVILDHPDVRFLATAEDRVAWLTSLLRSPDCLPARSFKAGTTQTTTTRALAENVMIGVPMAMPPAGDARTVVIVFSDGADTSSWLSDAEVLESARRSGVVIHVVAVRAGTVTSRFIPDLTDAAGGRVFSASSADDLRRLFTSALDEMRARYLVTFAPRSPTPGWHELKVSVRRGGIDVKARPGYFVSSPK